MHRFQTIAVTSANSRVGQMLLPRLTQQGYHTIALTRSPAKLPANQVIHDWMASTAAVAALENADAIVHLSGEAFTRTWQDYDAANVQTTERVTNALQKGKAQRVIFLSYPCADPQSSNFYLRAKGQAEKLLIDSGKEAVIFRVQAIINTPEAPGPIEENLIASEGKKVRILGGGHGKIAIAYRGDVVEAIVKSLEVGRAGIYGFRSPDDMNLIELVRMLNRDPNVAIAPTPKWLAKTLSWFIPDLSPTTVDLFLRNYPPINSEATITEFGLQPISLYQLWK